jgi:hypothetical protein
MSASQRNPLDCIPASQAKEQFAACPFCGCDPNVLELPSETISGQTVWAVECRNLGCVFRRSASYGLLRELAKDWNSRTEGGAT